MTAARAKTPLRPRGEVRRLLLDAARTLFAERGYAGTSTRAIAERAGVANSLLHLVLFPVRIAAAWAFFRMKKWGLQMMITTSWMYAFLWTAYLVDKMLTFHNRFGTTEFGVAGFWAFNLFYWTPFLMLPYLYSLKRQNWTDA